jgi:hypothetical protein
MGNKLVLRVLWISIRKSFAEDSIFISSLWHLASLFTVVCHCMFEYVVPATTISPYQNRLTRYDALRPNNIRLFVFHHAVDLC